MGKYRNKIEIMADILRVASDGARKTHIMYRCNLSYKLLRQYLRDALKAELICVEEKCGGFVITEKGRIFLEKFEGYAARSERVSQETMEVNDEREFLENVFSGERPFKSV